VFWWHLHRTRSFAIEGLRHLGYPAYFGPLLAVFKVTGALVLIIPAFKGRVKEWAYAGFGIVFISAAVSHASVDGLRRTDLVPDHRLCDSNRVVRDVSEVAECRRRNRKRIAAGTGGLIELTPRRERSSLP
jgi:hypothetical protein